MYSIFTVFYEDIECNYMIGCFVITEVRQKIGGPCFVIFFLFLFLGALHNTSNKIYSLLALVYMPFFFVGF